MFRTHLWLSLNGSDWNTIFDKVISLGRFGLDITAAKSTVILGGGFDVRLRGSHPGFSFEVGALGYEVQVDLYVVHDSHPVFLD